MSLGDNFGREQVSGGRLSSDALPLKATISAVISFVNGQLPAWVDDSGTPKNGSENVLNSSLCDFLDIQSRSLLPLFHFKNEIPQKGRRTVDLAAKPVKKILVSGHSYPKNEPFFVIEGKRLPPPGASRKREYVTGENEKITGGIQRFKLGEHGAKVFEAGIVGYVQQHSFTYWLKIINEWIEELATTPLAKEWKHSDKLKLNCEGAKTAYTISENSRSVGCISESILLHHFWADLKE